MLQRPIEATERPPTGRLYAYRPALDGLRALAVLPVMLYHADAGVAPGGFLGVDLFFVISGYLITTLLIRERAASGTIRLPSFWARRARRLFPAIFTLIAAVLVYGLFASAPEVARMRGDALATLAYASNWWFAFSGESYFEQFVRPSMLRHTWSLAIEEQFYIAWPLLLLLGLRSSSRPRRIWIVGCGLAALASAGWMALLFDPEVDPSRIYYGTDTRAQTLLVGVTLAFFLDAWPGPRPDSSGPTARSFWKELAAVAGLLACFAFFTLTTASTAWMYRGGYLLMAVASAMAIAGAVRGDERWASVRLLSTRPLVWIGARSYGLYLWHWPIFILFDAERIGLAHESGALLAIRFAITFVVAAASYRWLEAPIRAQCLSLRTERIAVVASPVAILGGIALVTLVFAPPSGELASASPGASPIRSDEIDPNALRVLVVGDSVALSLADTHPSHSPSGRPLAVSRSALVGCGVMQGYVWRGRDSFPHTDKCEGWPKNWAAVTRSFEPDVSVILVGAWEVFDHQVAGKHLVVGSPEFEAHLAKRLDLGLSILGSEVRPVVLLTVPCYNARFKGLFVSWEEERNDPDRREKVNAAMRRFAANRPETVTLLDLQGFVCPSGEYQATLDGVELHLDGIHYSKEGALLVWEWLLPILEQAVESSNADLEASQ